jgi:NAD(P)-dependent dehydrogenase (short-subunit alcohol dehydrogenase family)
VSSPNFSLKDKVAVVTGASRGIGRAIALAFAQAGANVAVCSRTLPDLEKVAEEIRGLGRNPLAVLTDVTSKSSIDDFVNKVVQEFGVIDILINNAARLPIAAPLLDLREDGWDKMMNAYLKGYYLCSQAMGRVMKSRKKGSIINIATTLAFRALPENGAYCVAKAGVIMLTKVLAVEVAKYNIRANAIAPGLTKTKFSEKVWSNPGIIRVKEKVVPLGRIAEPSDMMGAALFLASDASGYITGQTICVDGGESVVEFLPEIWEE